ncbi:MAG: polyphosphate polymerase domain-containing protein [Deltaproteobacteria bacterium]|nr:polyphosphate polymerase domain-containing protein [Deltaproteobacteria bacterium]
MAWTANNSEESVLSRHECKYFVAPHLLPQMRDYLSSFVEPDAYAASCKEYRYPVTSLYLDSPELLLYRLTAEGRKTRFKLRMRSYADGPDEPVWLEIKKRADKVVIKRRARVSAQRAAALLGDRLRHREPAARLSGFVDGEFTNLVAMLGARAAIRIRYQREAYQARSRDPVRITFDTHLERSAILAGQPGNESGTLWPVATDGVVLEIKFTEVFPSWVRELIRRFQLDRQSIPKYLMSMDGALRAGGYRFAGGAYVKDLMVLHAAPRRD